MNTTVYYFTGTGNSLKVAKDLANELGDTKLIKICNENINSPISNVSERIGFVFPVYFHAIPIMVKEFITNLNINKFSYVFAISTYAGSPGAPMHILNKILHKKGIKLSASYNILMPGNHQTSHDVQPISEQNARFKAQEEKIIKIAASIKNNDIIELKESGKILTSLITNFIFKPQKVYNLDRDFSTDSNCISCGTCSKVCPANNIVMKDGKPEWQHKCEACLACMQWCPKQSIQYKEVTETRGRYHHPEISLKELL
ncbi:EFR1 family ferrodoxin [Clostridium sp. YIM B02551]|uniref:EFR1 family ferrodoxin n=1 Tax=Clostridium sp. YIM B02551 TaxID=2910679 RepID=UPI001EEC14D8|nr:EFR1 family ferrodoxin [Clostridium sp. YIM B02551]